MPKTKSYWIIRLLIVLTACFAQSCVASPKGKEMQFLTSLRGVINGVLAENRTAIDVIAPGVYKKDTLEGGGSPNWDSRRFRVGDWVVSMGLKSGEATYDMGVLRGKRVQHHTIKVRFRLEGEVVIAEKCDAYTSEGEVEE